jgi:hypothetical protein
MLACVLAATPAADPARAQSATSSSASGAPNGGSGPLPVSLDRIRRELERPLPREVLRLPTTPTFTVIIEERLPLLSDFFGGDDWTFGPAPAQGMSHREFLNLVTPEYARPYASSVNGDLLQVLATSFATAYALQSGSSAVRSWLKARREAEAKREVEETLKQIAAQAPPPPPAPK